MYRKMAASRSQDIWGLKTFCIITGASKGLGRSLTKSIVEKLGVDSHVVLIARNEDGLKETKRLSTTKHGINVATTALDLSAADETTFGNVIDKYLAEFKLKPSDFKQTILVHNVGNLGDVSRKATELGCTENYQSYWRLNLTSCAVFNSVFISKFKPSNKHGTLLINISSLCALQPFKTWSLYCAGKAARDMFFRVLAEEEPNIHVLNYSPGALDTDMQVQARSETGDDGIRGIFLDMANKGSLLDPYVSSEKLIKIVSRNVFKSGDHIDYHDEILDG